VPADNFYEWTKMMGSRVLLLGRDQELELLMQSISGDLKWSMAKDKSGYYLIPKAAFDKDEVEAVYAAAKHWTDDVNLAGPLLFNEFQRISFSLEYVKEDGAKLHFVFQAFAGASSFAAAAGAVIGTDGKLVKPEIPIAAMAQAMARANVAEAVRLFHDRGEDWTQLCNVIQMVRNDLRTEIPRGWVSHDKLKLLERTAQFRKTAGDTARHVNASGSPPEKPMTPADAQELVRQILVHWCKHVSQRHNSGDR
jgi:hypothetical protein